MSRSFSQVNFRIPHDVAERLKAMSAELGQSLTQTIQHALEEEIRRAGAGASVQYKFRMPVEMHTELARSAKKAGRSMNAEVLRRLEQSFAKN